MLPLETSRLLLRELRIEDLADAHAFAGDPEVARHSAWGPQPDEQHTLKWLTDSITQALAVPRVIYELAVVEKTNSERVIGTAHLGIRNQERREAEIGYTLHRDFWGAGLATEVAQALIEAAFEELRLHRIYATASPLNVASHRVLEKSGMLREGLLRQNVWMRDHWRDSVIYAIIEPARADAPVQPERGSKLRV